MSEPEFLLPFLKSKIKPEVLHAIRVILGAIFEEAKSSCESAEEVRFHREREDEDSACRERMRRAERGVATRRKNAKKKNKVSGVLKRKRPTKNRITDPMRPRCRAMSIPGNRCERHGSHSGDHRDQSGYQWHPHQRVTQKKEKRK